MVKHVKAVTVSALHKRAYLATSSGKALSVLPQMPSLELTSNVSPNNLNAFLIAASAKFADAIGKPEKVCLVTFSKVEQMTYAGSTDPAFIAHIHSIGNIDNERNAGLSQSISQFLSEELNIPNTRGYFFFHNVKGEDTGYAGTTYTNLLAARK
jgi:Macrophage migration inhibitory factor (MIF)